MPIQIYTQISSITPRLWRVGRSSKSINIHRQLQQKMYVQQPVQLSQPQPRPDVLSMTPQAAMPPGVLSGVEATTSAPLPWMPQVHSAATIKPPTDQAFDLMNSLNAPTSGLHIVQQEEVVQLRLPQQ